MNRRCAVANAGAPRTRAPPSVGQGRMNENAALDYVGVAPAGTAALLPPHPAAPARGESRRERMFANDCCSSIKLADGKILLNDQQASATL